MEAPPEGTHLPCAPKTRCSFNDFEAYNPLAGGAATMSATVTCLVPEHLHPPKGTAISDEQRPPHPSDHSSAFRARGSACSGRFT